MILTTARRRPDAPRRGLLPCLILLTALGALDQTMMATALPDVLADLGSPEHAAWPVTAYTFALTATMPAAGALGDRLGRRRALLAALTLFCLASLACGLAGDLTVLTCARLVQGIGGAGLLALPQAVVADAVPVRDRAAYLGPLGAVFAVATVVSPLLGGWLTDAASWRWIFWVNLPLGVAAAALVGMAVPVVPTERARRARFDAMGAALLAVIAGALTLATARAGGPGWTAAAAGVAVLAAVVTVVWERRAADPVLPLRVLGRRTVRLCCGLALLAGFGLFGVLAYVPAWIQAVWGTSASAAGLMLLPVTVGIVVGTNASGLAVRRWGHWRLFPVAGCALSATAAAGLAVLSGRIPPLAVVAGLLAVMALGIGLFMQLVVVASQAAGPREATGKVTATLGFVRETGVLTGTALLGSLAVHGLAAAPGRAAAAAFTPVFSVTAGCFACALALALLLPPHRLGLPAQSGEKREVAPGKD
jgi:EmrB/QacA subfamily drug resistance transporter